MGSPRDTVPVEDFITFITPYAPAAPDEVIEHALREAVVWFARETRLLEDSVPITFQRRVRDYILEIPEGRDLIALDWTREYLHNLRRGNNMNITEHFFRDLFAAGYFRPQWHKDGIHPVAIFQFEPMRRHTHHMWYSWAPARDFCAVPKDFYEEWMEGIRHKTLYFLCSMPNLEWSDMGAAEMHERSAEKWAEKARMRRFANFTQGDRRMRARPFVRRNGWYYGGSTYYGGGV